jgi:hypothetical protein
VTDIEALLAALDGGDDTALAPLADALKDAGDPRAAGVRELLAWEGTLAPHRGVWGWRWYDHERDAAYNSWEGEDRAEAMRAILPYAHSWCASAQLGDSYARLVTTHHPSRSAAILALAELIVEAGQGCFT